MGDTSNITHILHIFAIFSPSRGTLVHLRGSKMSFCRFLGSLPGCRKLLFRQPETTVGHGGFCVIYYKLKSVKILLSISNSKLRIEDIIVYGRLSFRAYKPENQFRNLRTVAAAYVRCILDKPCVIGEKAG